MVIDQDGNLGKVFFAPHGPAVFVIHSQNLNEYLHHLLDFYEDQEDKHLLEIYVETVLDIWEDNSYTSPKMEFSQQNPEYQSFLEKFKAHD